MPRYTTQLGEFVPGRPRWWQWPTILSLDAPIVAVVWQDMLARVAGVALDPHHRLLLGASVWLAYSADRWIEGWRLTVATVRTQRHYFFIRWRWPAFACWLAILTGGVAVAADRFSPREWSVSAAMMVPTLLYLLSHQLLHRDHPWRGPNEVCVALILAGGAAVYPAALAEAGRWRLLGAPTIAFVLLCLTNCLLISEWEREVDHNHRQTSLALQLSHARLLARSLPGALVVLGVTLAE
ncbi:MAG: hypothetical protein CFE26_24910, partial [Verrucomicrobiales bacterium VVV1]